MALETATVRCDRCGDKQTFLDAEKNGVTYVQGVAQWQVNPQMPARQVMFHLCPACAMADPFFPNAKEHLVKADLTDLNRAGRRHGG